MRVLVTGASGFLGREVLRELDGHAEVFALSRTRADAPCADWIERDLLEPLDAGVLPDRMDAVVALAQSRDHRAFPERAHEIFAVNVRATLDLLEYARAAGAESFVYISTGGLAAEAPDASLSFYLNSKRASEALVESYASVLRRVVLRPFFIYGPGDSRMLIRTLAERVAAGEPVTVAGDPGMRINPVYVRDVARAVGAALRSGAAGTFDVAGDEHVTIRELVELIGAAAGTSPEIESGPGEAGELIGDNTRTKEALGVTPETPLADGLRALLADVRAG